MSECHRWIIKDCFGINIVVDAHLCTRLGDELLFKTVEGCDVAYFIDWKSVRKVEVELPKYLQGTLHENVNHDVWNTIALSARESE